MSQCLDYEIPMKFGTPHRAIFLSGAVRIVVSQSPLMIMAGDTQKKDLSGNPGA
jgi:hypothetical protein